MTWCVEGCVPCVVPVIPFPVVLVIELGSSVVVGGCWQLGAGAGVQCGRARSPWLGMGFVVSGAIIRECL